MESQKGHIHLLGLSDFQAHTYGVSVCVDPALSSWRFEKLWQVWAVHWRGCCLAESSWLLPLLSAANSFWCSPHSLSAHKQIDWCLFTSFPLFLLSLPQLASPTIHPPSLPLLCMLNEPVDAKGFNQGSTMSTRLCGGDTFHQHCSLLTCLVTIAAIWITCWISGNFITFLSLGPCYYRIPCLGAKIVQRNHQIFG